MILKGNQRGGGRGLALHLLKNENDHIEVHEIRGFMSDDLVSALKEAHLTSKATRAKKYLYSLSINPPANENVSTEDFEKAIRQVEKELKLTGQPRIIVFHEKNGRRHAHAVWSRIDTRSMTAINIYKDWPKLQELSRELFLHHGWKVPDGLLDKRNRNPNKFTLAQWQQAKRIGKVPKQIKADLQSCWALSHDKYSFEQELNERGYRLAKGDRRGFVVLDHKCEIFSLGKKWLGVPVTQVRSRLGNEHELLKEGKLRSVEETRTTIAKGMSAKIKDLKKHQTNAIEARMALLNDQLTRMVNEQRGERKTLKTKQKHRWQDEVKKRQARFNGGLRGILDFVTGKRKKIKAQNELETKAAQHRDELERETLVFTHLENRRSLQHRIYRLNAYENKRDKSLSQDLDQYHEIRYGKRNTFTKTQNKHDRGRSR